MKTLIVDYRIPRECERALDVRGYRIIKLRPNPLLSEPVASHTDMLIFSFEDEIISTADYCDAVPDVFEDIHTRHLNLKVTFTSDEVCEVYPRDCKMNALKMGRDLFINEESISPYIINEAKRRGFGLHFVKQGYPACTVLSISSEAAITADAGMARAIEKSGKRVYRISNGAISLPPYEYGFIGGAAFSDEKKIFFFGDIDLHPDKDIILSAIKAEGKEAVSLAPLPLVDLGGAVVIEQNTEHYRKSGY